MQHSNGQTDGCIGITFNTRELTMQDREQIASTCKDVLNKNVKSFPDSAWIDIKSVITAMCDSEGGGGGGPDPPPLEICQRWGLVGMLDE